MTASSSFIPLDSPFAIQYGSGAAAGDLGRDVVRFAGFEVENQAFGAFASPVVVFRSID